MVFMTTGAHAESSVSAAMPMNKFVLVTGVYDKNTGTQSLFLDGKLAAQATGQKELTPVVALEETAVPGIGIGTNNQFQKSVFHFGWDGVINDLRVYNRAILPNDVQALYKLGVAQAKRNGLDLLHQQG
jgi:hypothetical protein